MLPSGPTVSPSTLDGTPGVTSGRTARTSTSPRSNAPAGAAVNTPRARASPIAAVANPHLVMSLLPNSARAPWIFPCAGLDRDHVTGIKRLQPCFEGMAASPTLMCHGPAEHLLKALTSRPGNPSSAVAHWVPAFAGRSDDRLIS